ncbi:hypothetical protein DXG01_000133 [Tephrocybe rancida]|nr:hypothetical protein DXG01_000133 [Tephrocybe rancida]
MSVFIRRSLCFPCPRNTLARSFLLTPSLSRSATTTSGLNKAPKKTRETEKEIEPPQRNLLVETKLQEYLDHIATTSDISLADFEREYKPFRRPKKTEPKYEEAYNKVVARLVRSFSSIQLRNLVKLYEVNLPGRPSKWQLAEVIVERKWRWPSPTSIKQERRDAETSYEYGANLLELSSEFGVHISFSSNPLSLKAEGSRASLSQLGEYISEFKKGVKEQYFSLLPMGVVEADSLQHISRISGVFVENAGAGLIRLTYKDGDESSTLFAKRHTLRAATEVRTSIPALIYSTQTQLKPTLGQVLTSHPTYSFYPFLPSQPQVQTPWQHSLFRVRRVEDWLRSGMNDDRQTVSRLAEGAPATHFSGNPVDLRQALFAPFGGLHTDERPLQTRITASFGHLLVSSGSSAQPSIKPPLSGPQDLSKVLEWFQDKESKRIFVSSLPHSLINCAPTKQRLIHRLVYRTSSTTNETAEEFLKFELVLDVVTPSAPNNNALTRLESFPNDNISSFEDVSVAPICWAESSSRLDILLPDSLTSPDQVSGQPDAPLSVTKGTLDYQLNSTSTVRQSLDPVPDISTPPDASLHTVAESVLELESKERSRVCQKRYR